MSLTAADVNQPFYYLHNFHSALHWVQQHSADLLSACEQQQLQALHALPQDAQALLLRMVMRKGESFRHSALNYAEIPATDAALNALQNAGFCQADAAVSGAHLSTLLRKDELSALLQRLTDASPAALKKLKKDALQQQLLALPQAVEQHTLHGWLGGADTLVQLHCMPLFDTIRLLFFGNVWQDWSEFVLTELGHQRYEAVALTEQSRAFRHRDELDFYAALSALQQQLHELTQALKDKTIHRDEAGDGYRQLLQALLALHTQSLNYQPLNSQPLSPWLSLRWHKALAQLGREAERLADDELALACYRHSQHRDAVVRALRVRELQARQHNAAQHDFRVLADDCQQALQRIRHPEAQISLQRLYARCAARAGLPKPPATRKAIKDFPSFTLTLPDNGDAVEIQVRDHLNAQGGGQCFYVENTLLPGLFALLFWEVLYAPLPGAFFHPFQSGPADLFRDEFAQQRQTLIDAAFARLHDGSYCQHMLTTWQQKEGISCPLLHWPSLPLPLLEQALAVIPAATLEALFRHLLADLRHHSRGLPDLVWLADDPAQGFRLIEVKGPGDRLQDHQRLWLEVFLQQGVDAAVCYVRYSGAEAG